MSDYLLSTEIKIQSKGAERSIFKGALVRGGGSEVLIHAAVENTINPGSGPPPPSSGLSEQTKAGLSLGRGVCLRRRLKE